MRGYWTDKRPFHTLNESVYLGDYVLGRTDSGVKVKILHDDGEVEICFPSEPAWSDDEKMSFMGSTKDDLLAAIGAE
jgi:hypothetical protein